MFYNFKYQIEQYHPENMRQKEVRLISTSNSTPFSNEKRKCTRTILGPNLMILKHPFVISCIVSDSTNFFSFLDFLLFSTELLEAYFSFMQMMFLANKSHLDI